MDILTHHINKGDRPSRLELARLQTGEVHGAAAESLKKRIVHQPRATAWLQELEDAAPRVQPFDAGRIRSRARHILRQERSAGLDAVQESTRDAATGQAVRPLPRLLSRIWHGMTRGAHWRRKLLLPGLTAMAAAAALLVVVVPQHGNRSKGGADIDFYVLRGGEVHPGNEDELHMEGDRIQFTYRSSEASDLVLLSVDGYGQINVFYPESGDQPEEIIPGQRRVLPGSIELDDAPDFELFIAFFGTATVSGAVAETGEVLGREGLDGLLAAFADDPDVDTIYIKKSGSSRRSWGGVER